MASALTPQGRIDRDSPPPVPSAGALFIRMPRPANSSIKPMVRQITQAGKLKRIEPQALPKPKPPDQASFEDQSERTAPRTAAEPGGV